MNPGDLEIPTREIIWDRPSGITYNNLIAPPGLEKGFWWTKIISAWPFINDLTKAANNADGYAIAAGIRSIPIGTSNGVQLLKSAILTLNTHGINLDVRNIHPRSIISDDMVDVTSLVEVQKFNTEIIEAFRTRDKFEIAKQLARIPMYTQKGIIYYEEVLKRLPKDITISTEDIFPQQPQPSRATVELPVIIPANLRISVAGVIEATARIAETVQSKVRITQDRYLYLDNPSRAADAKVKLTLERNTIIDIIAWASFTPRNITTIDTQVTAKVYAARPVNERLTLITLGYSLKDQTNPRLIEGIHLYLDSDLEKEIEYFYMKYQVYKDVEFPQHFRDLH